MYSVSDSTGSGSDWIFFCQKIGDFIYQYPSVSIEMNIRQISPHVQRRIRVDVGHVFGVKTNPHLKIKYTFEIFNQPAVKL